MPISIVIVLTEQWILKKNWLLHPKMSASNNYFVNLATLFNKYAAEPCGIIKIEN